MRFIIASASLLAACSSSSTSGPSTASGTAASGAASGTADSAPTKRPPAPASTKDDRPIDHSKFTLLNPYHDKHGVIFASEDGGCHVYIRDKSKPIGPPGSFPPATSVPCPPDMLKAEWGLCLGPGAISKDAAANECICQPGAGDPPGPSYRIPCPA